MSDWPWDIRLEVAWDIDPADEPGPGDWDTVPTDRLRAPLTVRHAPAGQPAESTLTLNNRDRAYDPTNAAATLNLIPLRHSRLTCVIGATTYPMHRGYVEDWEPAWPQYNQGLVSVRLTDALAWVALQDGDVALPAQFPGERINDLLDQAGWPAGRRDIDTGVVRLDPFEQDGANLLRIILDSADAEDGLLTVSPEGDVVFRDRHHDFHATPTLTFGPDDLDIAAVTPRKRAKDIYNIGRIELADGEVFEVVDDVSATKFGDRPWVSRDLSLPEPEAIALGQWVVHRFAQPTLNLDGLATHGHLDNGAPLPTLLAARVGDLADFTHEPPGGGSTEMRGRVTSIEHRLTKGGWTTTTPLASYHGDAQWFRWDDPVNGWDSGAVWAP